MNNNELKEILRLHLLWLNNDPKGKRINLFGANLFGANLYRADLKNINYNKDYYNVINCLFVDNYEYV